MIATSMPMIVIALSQAQEPKTLNAEANIPKPDQENSKKENSIANNQPKNEPAREKKQVRKGAYRIQNT